MLFRRRKPATLREKLREAIWPRKGFSRPLRYFVIRVLRLTASPHSIAIGVAAGAFVSWTPFIGVHFIMAFAICFLFAGNFVAAALGCAALGNPLTYPFIWGITWEVGHALLNRGSAMGGQSLDLEALFHQMKFTELWRPVIEPMLIGGILPGLVTALLLYGLTYKGVSLFKERRRQRLLDRARQRLALAAAEDGPSL